MSRSTQQMGGTLAIFLLMAMVAHAQQPTSPPATDPAATTQQPAAATHAQDQAAPEASEEVPVKRRNRFDFGPPKPLVELPATPMLDAEGHQRLDPDGKPLFNPPVRQQRDKHGKPLIDEHGNPVMQTPSQMGYDEKGKKLHSTKEKEPKTVSVSIERGTLTIDGMTGKAGLNYEIKNLRYIYFYAPWIGNIIVSPSPFPGATEQKNAFNDQNLTVTVDEHTIQLSSDKRLLGKKSESAFVAVDRNFKLPSKFPVIGYGETLKPPYAWPGSRENAELKGSVAPPPLPDSLRAVSLQEPCPAGQMRMPAKASSQGEIAQAQPCVPMKRPPPVPAESMPAPAPPAPAATTPPPTA